MALAMRSGPGNTTRSNFRTGNFSAARTESARIDRQLFGRCARQGEAGTVEAMVSLEDELFQRFAPTVLAL
jgi:hypothetical protein